MRLTLSGEEVAAYLTGFNKRVRETAQQAERTNIAAGRQELVDASSGTLSTATLKEMGHPFAVRAPQTPLDPAIVNDQGGPFARRWSLDLPVVEGGDTIVSRSRNDSPEAAFLSGTRFMVERPIAERVGEELRARRKQNVRAAVLAEMSHL